MAEEKKKKPMTLEERAAELERRLLAGEDVGSPGVDDLVSDIETELVEGELPPLPDLVDEEALKEKHKKVLKEERDRQRQRPGLRAQTTNPVLTSSRGKRPSLLSE